MAIHRVRQSKQSKRDRGGSPNGRRHPMSCILPHKATVLYRICRKFERFRADRLREVANSWDRSAKGGQYRSIGGCQCGIWGGLPPARCIAPCSPARPFLPRKPDGSSCCPREDSSDVPRMARRGVLQVCCGPPPTIPASPAVLTQLVAAGGSGGPSVCGPAVEHRHRARARDASQAGTAGSFARASCEGRTELPNRF